MISKILHWKTWLISMQLCFGAPVETPNVMSQWQSNGFSNQDSTPLVKELLRPQACTNAHVHTPWDAVESTAHNIVWADAKVCTCWSLGMHLVRQNPTMQVTCTNFVMQDCHRRGSYPGQDWQGAAWQVAPFAHNFTFSSSKTRTSSNNTCDFFFFVLLHCKPGHFITTANHFHE